MSQFQDTIRGTRVQLNRAAGDKNVTLAPDALELLNGALIKPGTTNVALEGDALYQAALGAMQVVRAQYGGGTEIDIDQIALLYFRLPPPWGKTGSGT